MQLDIRQAPNGGRADWLARQLRLAIADGRLPVGSKLPASRVLAAELGVSRGVVTEAYQRLTEDGHTAGHRRNGTTVVAAPPPQSGVPWVDTPGSPSVDRPMDRSGVPPGDSCAGPYPPVGVPAADAGRSVPAPGDSSGSPQPPVAVPAPGADRFATPPEANLFDALRALPARFDLTPGLPDLTAFPRAAWLRAERAVLGSLPSAEFGYGDPRGAPVLRRAIADWLARNRGVRADPDEVLIVSGTAQTLTLLGRVLRDAGIPRVAVEDPGALGARQHLAAQGLDTPPVPVDAEGVSVDALRATGAAAVLLTPAHQFPMGVVLGGVRRRELMRWATESGGLVIEDDYDAEHRYDRPPVPALRAMLPGHVCYAGSVSKLLAPALRIGWVLAPPPYRDALVAAKRLADLGNAVLPQLVLAHLMESGDLERQLRLLRTRHRRRRDAMAAAIKDHLPGATLHGAAAGLHLTITFDAAAFPDTLLAAAALARGVKAHPLSWHAQRPAPPGLVLGYAARTPTDITAAVATLGETVRAFTRRGAGRTAG
ncbi:PLP-dependent aminotransferase family protein [Streptomyces sp. NPDC051976]|uniref:aminotransferase-like domain-containing protein n=1 Tax=Streptomyces sp. NPDC051976 TaxID=3154947 RepID=UPI0034481A46